ncbi:hypothetical protein EI94DRAFT_885104 [Lactarius quietus]|nr:hypothetical protein EI94DRAFT_885104 [Lactarius quietus]
MMFGLRLMLANLRSTSAVSVAYSPRLHPTCWTSIGGPCIVAPEMASTMESTAVSALNMRGLGSVSLRMLLFC